MKGVGRVYSWLMMCTEEEIKRYVEVLDEVLPESKH